MTLVKFISNCCQSMIDCHIIFPAYDMIIDLPLDFSKTFLEIWFKKYNVFCSEYCFFCKTTIIQFEEYEDVHNIFEVLDWKKEIAINDIYITFIPIPFIKYMTEKVKEDLYNKKT